jgi:KaiC/GvpD/RAD55 family RecA-like ATPase
MIEGGIPDGDHVLIAGGPGAGKTLACFEFLYKNALAGRTGVFVSLEEKEDGIIDNAKDAFTNFDKIDSLLKSKKIVICEEDMESIIAESESKGERRFAFSKVMSDVISTIQKTKAKCVVVDSVSVFKLFLKDQLDYRVLTVSLLSLLKENGVTSLSTLELQDPIFAQSEFYPEFFLYDGLVMFYSQIGTGNIIPSLQIVKIRGTDHSYQNVPYKITNNGIKLLNMSSRA